MSHPWTILLKKNFIQGGPKASERKLCSKCNASLERGNCEYSLGERIQQIGPELSKLLHPKVNNNVLTAWVKKLPNSMQMWKKLMAGTRLDLGQICKILHCQMKKFWVSSFQWAKSQPHVGSPCIRQLLVRLKILLWKICYSWSYLQCVFLQMRDLNLLFQLSWVVHLRLQHQRSHEPLLSPGHCLIHLVHALTWIWLCLPESSHLSESDRVKLPSLSS